MLADKLNSGGSTDKLYSDSVFSTYLYTGNGSTQTINNGIDLAGKGGMVWFKSRSDATRHDLYDTARGVDKYISTNSTAAQTTAAGLSSYNSNGFTIGTADGAIASTGSTYASWTFRRSQKFFDAVTFTIQAGGVATFNHSLGVTPGMVVLKRTDSTSTWDVWHTSLSTSEYLTLNTTAAKGNIGTWITPTSTSVSISQYSSAVGATYVAYLFAHDSSSDSIIQAGSFTTDASGLAPVTLGWEPQWLMVKSSSTADNWRIQDSMRGWTADATSGGDAYLFANNSNAEASGAYGGPNATGFTGYYAANTTYIYLAIRRPNKPPTSGTQVYNAIARTGTGAAATVTGVGFAPDWVVPRARTGTFNWWATDRLRGPNQCLYFDQTSSEGSDSSAVTAYTMDGFSVGTSINVNQNTTTFINYAFRRAPGFMDVVAYTGTGSPIRHSLGAVPEFIIVKNRGLARDWAVYSATTGPSKSIWLNLTSPAATDGVWADTAPTATLFYGFGNEVNGAYNYVAYLFASLPGVSKVGSYTGNGSSQTINCGFSAGARFVLIKRTDSTGDWYVWDTARGIVSANDPHLSLNTTAAEVTTDDSIDPDSTGFIVNQVAATNINVNAATYIFLAIA